ncbi:hypothetical protein NEHOM01_0525 [Nematocida homosporus]|uniref:uncharacterized protein n=1 Tax=Nematocida homosporus TaxID=1912981 RepID=UPI002220368F|nr:uncharacterized protein NEHOM01_0525 [Nematocida homosporus]KAI5184974.1 hypothetical protein NEHOM01_0525 [Nematocida homosporus]
MEANTLMPRAFDPSGGGSKVLYPDVYDPKLGFRAGLSPTQTFTLPPKPSFPSPSTPGPITIPTPNIPPSATTDPFFLPSASATPPTISSVGVMTPNHAQKASFSIANAELQKKAAAAVSIKVTIGAISRIDANTAIVKSAALSGSSINNVVANVDLKVIADNPTFANFLAHVVPQVMSQMPTLNDLQAIRYQNIMLYSQALFNQTSFASQAISIGGVITVTAVGFFIFSLGIVAAGMGGKSAFNWFKGFSGFGNLLRSPDEYVTQYTTLTDEDPVPNADSSQYHQYHHVSYPNATGSKSQSYLSSFNTQQCFRRAYHMALIGFSIMAVLVIYLYASGCYYRSHSISYVSPVHETFRVHLVALFDRITNSTALSGLPKVIEVVTTDFWAVLMHIFKNPAAVVLSIAKFILTINAGIASIVLLSILVNLNKKLIWPKYALAVAKNVFRHVILTLFILVPFFIFLYLVYLGLAYFGLLDLVLGRPLAYCIGFLNSVCAQKVPV